MIMVQQVFRLVIRAESQKNEWPAYNTILNCTSYYNCDSAQNDADGFAAKLSVGEGNVFDGCVSYNNADDGYDLYAKEKLDMVL